MMITLRSGRGRPGQSTSAAASRVVNVLQQQEAETPPYSVHSRPVAVSRAQVPLSEVPVGCRPRRRRWRPQPDRDSSQDLVPEQTVDLPVWLLYTMCNRFECVVSTYLLFGVLLVIASYCRSEQTFDPYQASRPASACVRIIDRSDIIDHLSTLWVGRDFC